MRAKDWVPAPTSFHQMIPNNKQFNFKSSLVVSFSFRSQMFKEPFNWSNFQGFSSSHPLKQEKRREGESAGAGHVDPRVSEVSKKLVEGEGRKMKLKTS